MSDSGGHAVQFTDTEGTKTSSTGKVGDSATGSDRVCMRCGKAAATMSSDPCNHYECCSKCAMKMATGGRCKTCKNMYASFQTLRPVSPTALGEDDD